MTSPSSLTPLPQHSPLESSPSSLSLLLNNTDDVERATTSSACASPVKRSWSSLETTDSAISKLPHLSPTRRTNKTIISTSTTTPLTDDSPIANDIKSPLFIVDKQHQQPMKEESSSQPYGSSGGTFTTFSLKQPMKEESPLQASESSTSDTTTSSTTPVNNNNHSIATISSSSPSTSAGAIVKPYACNECEQSFCRPHNLKSHQATHSSIRPFKCGACDKNFRRLHDLKRHEKLHTGEKPYVCDHCSRSFSRLDALNRHQKAENAARRWSDSDVSHRQPSSTSASGIVTSTSSSPSSSSSSPPPPPLVVSPSPIPNHHEDNDNSNNKDIRFSSDNTTTNKPSNDTPSSQLDHPATANTTDNSNNNNNNSNSNNNIAGGGKIKKKSIKSLVQGQQHRFRSARPNIPQINIPNPATKWPPISSTLATIRPTAMAPSSSPSSSSNMTSSSPSPIGSPIILTTATATPSSLSTTAVPVTKTVARHTTSYGGIACHESSLPTPETAHPFSSSSTTNSTTNTWNHHSASSSSSSSHQLPPPPPPPPALNPHPSTRTVLPPVIRQNQPQDHHLMSPYSPFTPIASPLSQQSSHAVLLQKYRDLEAKIAILEKEKTTQQDAMNGKIHDLEVENRLLRSLVADSQRLSNGNGNSAEHYSLSRNQTNMDSPGTM